MSIELVFENAQLKGRVIALDAEVKCLEAVIRSHERVDCLSVTSLKKQLVEADAENARLKAEVENSKRINTELLALSNRQASDIRRLTKAGDWMMADLIPYQQFDGFKSVKDWNAAKGVQS